MTLFTKDDCKLCQTLKDQFDLEAMQVNIEILGKDDADALAHLAWHGLVETARKTLPILVLDDSSTMDEYSRIENHLFTRADQQGIPCKTSGHTLSCEGGSCNLQ